MMLMPIIMWVLKQFGTWSPEHKELQEQTKKTSALLDNFTDKLKEICEEIGERHGTPKLVDEMKALISSFINQLNNNKNR